MVYRDITPLGSDGPAMRAVTDALIEPFAGGFDIAGRLQALAVLFLGRVAAAPGGRIRPVRRARQPPQPAAAASCALEYGTATIDGPYVLVRGERVLLVDDILAAGGPLTAAQSLVADLGAEVIGPAVVLELPELGGRRLTGDVHAVFAG